MLILLTLLSSACFHLQNNKALFEFEAGKKAFNEQYSVKTLFSHFPLDKINKIKKLYIEPPSKRGMKNSGLLYGIYELSEDLIPKEFIQQSVFRNDSNIIVDISELKKSYFPNPKYNIWQEQRFPIPNFEDFNFGLGVMELSKTIKGEEQFKYLYTVPDDLCIYVVDSKHGDFWSNNVSEKRPVELKEWRNGYTKGYSVSEKNNIIIFWTAIW